MADKPMPVERAERPRDRAARRRALDVRNIRRHKKTVSSVCAMGAIGAAVMAVNVSAVAAEIRWTGDAACRRELEVAEQVTSMIGRQLPSIDDADFEVDTRRDKDGIWRLELKTVRRSDGARSSRSLRGKTCVEVTDAAAVAIALAVGPGPGQPELPIALKSAASADAPASTHALAKAELEAHDTLSSSSLIWFGDLAGALDSSVTPNVALGGALSLGLSWLPSRASSTTLRFELEGAFYAPTESSNSNGRGGKFQLATVTPLVCGEKPLGANALLGCLGYEVGQLSGEGSGSAVAASHRRGTFWSAARAELGLHVPFGSGLRAFGRSGAVVALVRRDFALDGTDVVFRAAALSFRARLGLELLF